MELAPLLASVCTICGEEMPSESPLSAGHQVLATASVAAKVPKGLLGACSLLHLHPVRPPKVVGPI